MKEPTVAVYGLGYIGLPTAAILADTGLTVTGIDLDAALVALVNAGCVRHHDEAGLPGLVARTVAAGRLSATVEPVAADVHVIAVGTPIKPDKSPDLDAVEAVARSIARVLRRGDLVVLESTVPPLTCEGLVADVIRDATGLNHTTDYLLAHCPERVIPGNLLTELVHNDRVVGGTTLEATAAAASLYRRFVRGSVIETDARTAETAKLLENTYRDVNIALANELAALASSVGVDPDAAFALANRHPRVNLHRPGIGVGGHCIPVDPWFLVAVDPGEALLLRTARAINDALPARVAQAIRDSLRDAHHVTVLGISYKPDVDDMRESPAVEVVRELAADERLTVDVVEPHCEALPAELAGLPNVRLVPMDQARSAADLVVLLTPHKDFAGLLAELPNAVDARALLYASRRGVAEPHVEPLPAERPVRSAYVPRAAEVTAGRF
jgi:UDP-N-acetyl-D-mannosaminuronic acid dehydrogenase